MENDQRLSFVGSGKVAALGDLLDMISTATGSVASMISLQDATSRDYRTLINLNYPTEVETHLNTTFMRQDPAMDFYRSTNYVPSRWGDMPFDYRTTPTAREFLLPAGYQEGVTMLLGGPHSTEFGALHLNVSRADRLDTRVMSLLRSARSVLNHELRDPSGLGTGEEPVPATDGEVVSCAFLSSAGLVPRGPTPAFWSDLLARGDLAAVCAALWRTTREQGVSRCLRGYVVLDTTLVLLGDIRSTHAACHASLALRPHPYNLSEREIEVCGLIAQGLGNIGIARRLRISTRTVGNHVDRLLRKLDCGNRTEVAIVSLRESIRLLRKTLWP